MHPRLFNELHVHRLGDEDSTKEEEESIDFRAAEAQSEPIDDLCEVLDEESKAEDTGLLDSGNIYD